MRRLAWLTRTAGMGAMLLAVSWLIQPVAAKAQNQGDDNADFGESADHSSAAWDFTLGAGAAVMPTYPGAKRHRVEPIPFFSVKYRDLVFFTPEGLGVNAIRWGGFHAGPIVGFDGWRHESSDYRDLTGMGNIAASVTAGIFASYELGHFEFSVTAKQAVTHTDNGLQGVAKANYRMSLIPGKLDLMIGPRVEIANRHYNDRWFGVTPEQSERSEGQSERPGLPAYRPGAGLKDAGGQLYFAHHLSDHVTLSLFGSCTELLGDDAKSPIVKQKLQPMAGFGASYHF